MLQLISDLPSPWREAVQGALLGDALGVPHEFKSALQLPPAGAIQMVMPADYPKTYAAIPYGRWSDDGSQLIALLDVLVRGKGVYSEEGFLENLLAWWRSGRFQAGGQVFDIGGQTRAALESHAAGEQPAPMAPGYCGNGSLMRVLPVALLPDLFGVSPEDALRTAMLQSNLTHPQKLARVSCALYVELCWHLAGDPGGALKEHLVAAEARLRARGVLSTEEQQSLDMLAAFKHAQMPTGSGYVANTFWSAIWAVAHSATLSDALRAAVGLGNDTDTVACIAGGLAGLRCGLDDQSRAWWAQMDLSGLSAN